MSIAPLLVASIILPAAAPPPQVKPAHREVALDPAASSHQEDVRGAPFTLTAVVLPEPYSQATCGNCTSQTGPQPENWFLQLAPEEHTIYVKPTRLPDEAHPVRAFNTTLHITLASGYRININLGLADLYGTNPPDAEVAFTLAAKATLAGRLAEEAAKQETEFKDRLEQQSTARFLDYLLGEIHCTSPSSRPHVSDKLYVRLVQTCSVAASPPTYWAVFEVMNRSSAIVSLAKAVLGPDGDTGEGESRRAHRFERAALRFDDSTRGVAVFTLGADTAVPAAWRLELDEEGGKARKLSIRGLDF